LGDQRHRAEPDPGQRRVGGGDAARAHRSRGCLCAHEGGGPAVPQLSLPRPDQHGARRQAGAAGPALATRDPHPLPRLRAGGCWLRAHGRRGPRVRRPAVAVPHPPPPRARLALPRGSRPPSPRQRPSACRGSEDLLGTGIGGSVATHVTPNLELWRAYRRSKDPALRERLSAGPLSPAKFLSPRIGRRPPQHFPLPSPFPPGLMGSLAAVDDYDPERGVSFSSYASHRIRGAIFDELRRLDWMPRGSRARMRHAQRAIDTLSRRLVRLPTDQEVARELGVE